MKNCDVIDLSTQLDTCEQKRDDRRLHIRQLVNSYNLRGANIYIYHNISSILKNLIAHIRSYQFYYSHPIEKGSEHFLEHLMS